LWAIGPIVVVTPLIVMFTKKIVLAVLVIVQVWLCYYFWILL
jgi:hypothetical protein